MKNSIWLIRVEVVLLSRSPAFVGLMLLLLLLMTLAIWNTNYHISYKKTQVDTQKDIVKKNDTQLIAQIDSLNKGLATYEQSYTLPTSGVRLTYNNHRVTCLPFKAFSLIAIGQGDIYSNYKKIVLYFNDSYEMTTQELVSPIEQIFGQLDLAFVWVYLLPLIIILISYNILAAERETGRLPLIASQPIQVSFWILIKTIIRLSSIIVILLLFTAILLSVFGVSPFIHLADFGQLALILILYVAFWFLISTLINLLGYSSGSSLIILTSIWVLFVFLIPSIINQASKELHQIPSRLEVVNHHQMMYNEMESHLDQELVSLHRIHPDWASDDSVTKDMSNSTGWNINYLAKQYIAQLKHQSFAQNYEEKIDLRNHWLNQLRVLSPAMILQSSLSDMAGTSTNYYRSFLKQSQNYSREYRMYVFKRLFTNHAFTSTEIKHLPAFKFDNQQVPNSIPESLWALGIYLLLLSLLIFVLIKKKVQVK